MKQQKTLSYNPTKAINIVRHEQFISLIKPFQKIESTHQKKFDADKDNWISKELQLYGFPTFALYYHTHYILQKDYVVEMNRLRAEFKKKNSIFNNSLTRLLVLEEAMGIDYHAEEKRKMEEKIANTRKKNGMIPGKQYTYKEILALRRQRQRNGRQLILCP